MRTLLFALSLASLAAAPVLAAEDPNLARAQKLLKTAPVIDGHNDWAEQLRQDYGEGWWKVDLGADSRTFKHPLMTDIPRLHAGGVGGQFWSVYVPATVTGPAAVKATLDQIDIVRGIIARYPQHFELATTAADWRRIIKAGRIASVMGVEGGSQIDNDLAVLRSYHALGARYMTLTHVLNNDWADSATAPPQHKGLTDFGRAVIHEMNRIGMLVDLSHVSPATMKAALAVTRTPVIFSHSSARALNDHPRNVPDDVLALLPANGGVVMANYVPAFISEERRLWETERAAARARFGGVAGGSPQVPNSGLYIGQPDKAAAAMADWEKAHPMPRATLAQVADHIEHIARVAGKDHVGLGADLDGIEDTPIGLEGVETYPALVAELLKRGWSEADCAKLTSGNILRVLGAAEAVAAGMKAEVPPDLKP